MPKYLLDTNILLRLSNPDDAKNPLVTAAVAALLNQGDECYLTAQVLVELWVVATRPTDVNGLGWSVAQVRRTIDQLLKQFPLTEDNLQIFPAWLELVTANQIQGKRAHDARIVAVMLSTDIRHILTLNPKDFFGISEITVVHPQTIGASPLIP
jgi:predicted nucleic acid-binding protein